MKLCKIEGCENKVLAKGICPKHYQRYLKGKDPSIKTQREKSIEERFTEKLSDPDPTTGCIEWMSRRDTQGYGYFRISGRPHKSHRLAYELKHGPIPEGMFVLHRCDNPPCCNVDHLFLGTQADNMHDMISKGRKKTAKGELHGNSKLTNSDVIEIKRMLSNGGHQGVIAERFGVCSSAISSIKKGKNWGHV